MQLALTFVWGACFGLENMQLAHGELVYLERTDAHAPQAGTSDTQLSYGDCPEGHGAHGEGTDCGGADGGCGCGERSGATTA
jgi:hypothetical protein